MKEQLSPSLYHPHDRAGLHVIDLRFVDNGPYSFSVSHGSCLGLCGVSGIGKSQLLRCLADLIPFSGSVLLDGVESSTISAPIWRSRVMMVSAEPCWWYDEVGMHFSPGARQTENELLLSEFGFSTDVMNWSVSRLSTGEKQRLALFRSLVLSPKVLLLDEPTSALDDITTNKVESILTDYKEGNDAILLWVSHDKEQLLRVSQNIILVEKNRLRVTNTGKKR